MSANPDNPLLDLDALPRFSAIRPEHVVPAVEHLLAQCRAVVERALASGPPHGWDSLVAPIEAQENRLNRAWSPVSHLHSVADSAELREAYNQCLPLLSDYATEMGQHEALFQAYRSIAEGAEYAALDDGQRKTLDDALRDFRLGGVDLPAESKARYREIARRLASLASRFEENVLDATQAWKLHLSDAARLAGVPDSARALARQHAEREGLDGWLLTLELPSYLPVLTYADDRALRRELYEAYTTRASDRGPHAGRWDNTAVMEELLALRHEKAALLGFASYAELSLATKMARSPAEVLDFLTELAQRSRPVAQRELAELEDFAAAHHGHGRLEAWDIPYFSEKLRQHRYAVSQEALRPYFPVPRVLEGLFGIVERVYGIRVSPGPAVDAWHEDVRFFEIRDADGALRGQFYLDLYARPAKRGGAWMDGCVVRSRTPQGVETPVAHLVCNFTPPVGGEPSLLTHGEVTTLFHEFGHGLHHLLTKVDYPSVSGINGVPWDAVELPSQFMENWCWEREALALFARHHRTGEPLPDETFERMLAARNFQSGMQTLRQLEFALFDFRLHAGYEPTLGGRVQAHLDAVRREIAVVQPPEFNRFAHAFSHIFAGGYAAGYYSYKWAEVLASDAFAEFEANGIFDRPTGERFARSILERGGSRDAMALYVDFRGREPTIDALLRRSGLTAEANAPGTVR